jgi:hypothetical protein
MSSFPPSEAMKPVAYFGRAPKNLFCDEAAARWFSSLAAARA